MNISNMKFPHWHIPTDESSFSKWRTFRKCFPNTRNRLENCFKVFFNFCFQINFTKKYHKCYISVLHIFYLAYFTCKVAAHSPDDHLSQWDWKKVCPGITFLAPTRPSQMLLAAGCSFATLCSFCAALKGLTRVENRTSGLHQLSQELIFTKVPMVTKEQKIGHSGYLKNKLTDSLSPSMRYLSTHFSPTFPYLLALFPLGKITYYPCRSTLIMAIQSLLSYLNFLPLCFWIWFDLIWFALYVLSTHENP